MSVFNPDPVIQTIALSAQQNAYVIDGVFSNPEGWVTEASARIEQFVESPGNAYPGIELPMPPAINQAIIGFFSTYILRRFGIRRITGSYSRLSMVTKSPDQLKPRQWICHRDGTSVPAGSRMLASVVYLFKDESLGGTSLYQPKRSVSETEALVRDASVLAPAAFTAKYGIAPGFMTEGNDWFEKTVAIPARWNRMVVYDGMVFHSGDIRRPEAMNADPGTGRLSLNGFYTGRLNLA
jgi:hypothetical protein